MQPHELDVVNLQSEARNWLSKAIQIYSSIDNKYLKEIFEQKFQEDIYFVLFCTYFIQFIFDMFRNQIKADPVVVGQLEKWFSNHKISPQIITRYQCRV